MLATATAASPDATLCSAKQTRPLPNPSSIKPVSAELVHCVRVGAAMPRQRRNP
jgi:hypothetical protein